MPTKFKKDGIEYRGSRAQRVAVKKKYFISQTPKQELIDYINSPSGKPKIKQKCRNELTRRGVRLVWKDKEAL
tara:strand:- start:112 stop:330 length:219 start_codon:yes stop_codon:yes gene_type:complete